MHLLRARSNDFHFEFHIIEAQQLFVATKVDTRKLVLKHIEHGVAPGLDPDVFYVLRI